MILTILITVLAGLLLALSTRNVFQRRDRPNGQPLLLLLGGLTIWSLLAVAAQVATTVSLQHAVGVVKFAIVVPMFSVPPIWTTYVLGYAGRETGLTRRRILMIAAASLPIVVTGGIVAIVAIDPAESVGGMIIAGLLLLLFLALLYPLVMLGYGGFVLVRLSQKQASLSNLQVVVLLLAITAPYLGVATEWGDLIGPGVSTGLLVAGGFFAVAIRRYPLLSRFPKSESVARTRVVESLQEAVVVLNWEGRVLDVNESLTQLLDESAEALIGNPITTIIDGIEEADLSAGTTALTTLKTTKGRRQFQYTVSAVDAAEYNDTSEETPVSRAVIFRDVTDERTQQQRLKVLNRILRHNVRNRLDVVLAHAEQIEAETPRCEIRENATDLVELSERAREAEDIMQASTEPPETVDLVTIAKRVTNERSAAASGAEITLTSPEELTITSHRIIVRQLLSELVENAIKHTEEPTPQVSIRVEKGEGARANLVVADNGPGIPNQEQAVLNAETETPLKHSQGIGLWFVKWAVTQLGGELSIEKNAPHGSIVTARIRDASFEDESAE